MISVFSNAKNLRLKNTKINITNNGNISTNPPLDVLYQRVSPHAILNEGGRGEDAKCHTGTRMELIGLIEKWMDDAESDRIFWMSAPAGGGKTAIMKTIVERSAATDREVHTINFFFFRGDSTRNSAQPVVPTLLYQLFQLYPSSVDVAADFLSKRPRVLDESLGEQVKLLSALIPTIRQQSPTGVLITLLIDGLDECDVDAGHAQAGILRALEQVVVEPNSPFRLLVASRRESLIQMVFNQLSSSATSIFLDEEYRPNNDIRIFVEAEFDKIKASHPLKSSLPGDWPAPADVSFIVAQSSGQFVYVATVMRYIAHHSMVPSLALKHVNGLATTGKNSPFAHLDNIYAFVLSQASDEEALHDILSVAFIPKSMCSHQESLYFFKPRYQPELLQSCISQVSAILSCGDSGNFVFYHASLKDFLQDPTRSGKHFINVNAFMARFLISTSRKRYKGNDKTLVRYTQEICIFEHPNQLLLMIKVLVFNPRLAIVLNNYLRTHSRGYVIEGSDVLVLV